jgi:MFS family permease
VASLLAGGLVARLGPILLTQASLAAAGLALLLTTAAVRPAVFALSGLAIGLAYGQLSPAASQVLARHSPPRHMPLIFSIKQTGNTLGGAVAGVAVAAAAVALGWRGACVAVGLLCLLLAAATAPARRRFDDEAGRG